MKHLDPFTIPVGVRYRPIRRVLRNRLLARWGIMAAVAAAFAVLCVVASPFCDKQEQGFMIGLTVLVYGFIFWRSGVLPRTFAKEWYGTVLARESEKVMKMPKGVATRSNIYWTVVCKWTIRRDRTPAQQKRDEEGDVEVLTFDTEEIWERYFDIGERVHMYKNAKYPIKAHPQREDENLLCPLCGLLVMEPRCPHCQVDFSEEGTERKGDRT